MSGLFCMMAVFIPLLGMLIHHQMARAEACSRAWQFFCAEHGYRYVPASGPWYARQRDRIEGSLRGVSFVIDTFLMQSGKHSHEYTRITARARTPMSLKARIYPEMPLGFLGDLLGLQDVVVGEPRFDRACVVKASDEALVRSLLDEALREELLGWFERRSPHAKAKITYENGEIQIVWLGLESQPAVLANTIELAVAVGSAQGVAQGIIP